MTKIEKNIFISYRRKDISWALAVYQYLTGKKYDVFFDYTNIPGGDFEQIIVSNIKARAHFVLILTPTALDRCGESGDWLRREIETAIDEKRNIIPLFFDGFNFGSPAVVEKLTGKLGAINRYNGIEVPASYFIQAMERLCSPRFLSRPLDTVLHPITTEVQKVVKEEQVAADKALEQKREVIEELIHTAPKKVNRAKETHPINEVQNHTHKSAEGIDRKEKGKGVRKEAKQGVAKVGGKQPKKQAAKDTRPVPIINPDRATWGGVEFCRVPSGKFLMGSADIDDQALPDEKPQHTVSIPYDFWIARFPVTNEQYAVFINAKGMKHPIEGWENIHDHPVTFVSREDAVAYSSWLNDLIKGELPKGLVPRLPTEAEWEKAARGTGGGIYPWGNVWDAGKCNNDESGPKTTTPVGKFSPQGDSPFGCADMSGNVWECTHSFYRKYPYSAMDGREREIMGLVDIFQSPRSVVRGGSFHSRGIDSFLRGGGTARCAFRRGEAPGGRGGNRGFRLAVSVFLL